MISVAALTKSFGAKRAVDDLSFDVASGTVTGFLGPNGSGKSTTMRCMLDLDRPERGVTMFDGRPYRTFAKPLHEVGALLDAGYVHPGRSGRNHLRWVAATNGIARRRVDDVLEQVGLTQAAGRRVKGYSLGMRQRLGLAAVLLGDPHTVVLDEPANGLDEVAVGTLEALIADHRSAGGIALVATHLPIHLPGAVPIVLGDAA